MFFIAAVRTAITSPMYGRGGAEGGAAGSWKRRVTWRPTKEAAPPPDAGVGPRAWRGRGGADGGRRAW